MDYLAFRKLVDRMMKAQRRYFDHRDRAALREAQRLEQAVRVELKRPLGERDLFDREAGEDESHT